MAWHERSIGTNVKNEIDHIPVAFGLLLYIHFVEESWNQKIGIGKKLAAGRCNFERRENERNKGEKEKARNLFFNRRGYDG